MQAPENEAESRTGELLCLLSGLWSLVLLGRWPRAVIKWLSSSQHEPFWVVRLSFLLMVRIRTIVNKAAVILSNHRRIGPAATYLLSKVR